jgi:hypothetical protein
MRTRVSGKRLPPSYVAIRITLQVLVLGILGAAVAGLIFGGVPGQLWAIGENWSRVVRDAALPW